MNIIETLKSKIGDDGIKILESNGMLANVQLAMIEFREDVIQKKKKNGGVIVQDVEDSVGSFISERGYSSSRRDDRGALIKKCASDIYKEYCDFCSTNGSVAYSSVRFFMTLSEMFFYKRRTGQGIIYEVWVEFDESGLKDEQNESDVVETSINAFLKYSNYSNNAKKLFGENVEVEFYNASINGVSVGVREDFEANLLYKEYREFCKDNNGKACYIADFSSGMLGLSFKKKRTSVGMVYEIWINMDKHRELHPDCYV